MKHSVATYRAAGLEARWSRTRLGVPIIIARNPNSRLEHQRSTWWHVSRAMHADMSKHGVIEGFDRHTLLGDVFSISA